MTAEQRRQQIIDSAAGLFDRTGYASATMDDIARSVGVAKPTLYHYFSGKDQILEGIHEDFNSLLILRHEQRSDQGLGPEQLLLEIMADLLDLMDTHRGHLRVFFEHYRELPEDAWLPIRAERDRYFEMVRKVVTEGMADGTFRVGNARLVTLAMFGMCNWAYQWYDPNGPLRSREIAYRFWNIFVNGISARGVAAGEPQEGGA